MEKAKTRYKYHEFQGHISTLSTVELRILQNTIRAEMKNVEEQLEKSRKEQDNGNEEWYQRADRARYTKSTQIKLIDIELATRKETLHRKFYEIAGEIIPTEMFNRVEEEAHRQIEQQYVQNT
jgi:hypothetical protein